MTTVSLALIVKNEEHTLGRCLDSLRKAMDEIVVVDTGSDDATKAVARRYTDCVFDFPWRQDFAAARQFAFERATGDWVAWVDADDVVRGAEQIKPLVASATGDVGAFYWRYVCELDPWGNPTCEFWRERCVRNDGSFRWQGRIHEVLVPQRPWTVVSSPEVVVEHHRAPESGAANLRRNLAILEAEQAAAEGTPSPRLLFYLGSDYAATGEAAKALAAFGQYLEVATWDEERYVAQIRIADLQRSLENYEPALTASLEALKIFPHWPDAYFGLAKTYYFMRDWPKVVHWTHLAREMRPPQTMLMVNPMDYRYNWIIYYTNALYHLGELQEALAWTRMALEICPDNPWHRENFLVFARALQAIPASGPTDSGITGALYG